MSSFDAWWLRKTANPDWEMERSKYNASRNAWEAAQIAERARVDAEWDARWDEHCLLRHGDSKHAALIRERDAERARVVEECAQAIEATPHPSVGLPEGARRDAAIIRALLTPQEPVCSTCGGSGTVKVRAGSLLSTHHVEAAPCPDCQGDQA